MRPLPRSALDLDLDDDATRRAFQLRRTLGSRDPQRGPPTTTPPPSPMPTPAARAEAARQRTLAAQRAAAAVRALMARPFGEFP